MLRCGCNQRMMSTPRMREINERIHSTILEKNAVLKPDEMSTPVSGPVTGDIFLVLVS